MLIKHFTAALARSLSAHAAAAPLRRAVARPVRRRRLPFSRDSQYENVRPCAAATDICERRITRRHLRMAR